MTSVADTRLLNLVIFAPAVFAALVAFLPQNEKFQIRVTTLVGMVASFFTTAWAWYRFIPQGPEFQLEYRLKWVDSIGLTYHVGVDGLAVALVLLTGILGPLVVLSSWTSVDTRVKEFHLALLLLQTSMLGALCALDVMVFYIFFEAMLIPMFLLVLVWGAEDRQRAAMKFFLYTLVGSLLMLVALLATYFMATPPGTHSFDYAAIYNGLLPATAEVARCTTDPCVGLSPVAASLAKYGPWLFLCFALAFAIKVPMVPVHTWLPEAHVQAPVAGSMVLAGVMLKMGTFGFWRYAIPLFPAAAKHFQHLLGGLALIGIVYGALMCLAQTDVKKLIAYSSVSHLGYCMLGIMALTPEGATGSAYQMLNHGVSTGALFLLFGMLYERRHVRDIAEYGGIAKVMPVFTTLFVIVTFSSIAVPGTNGFVGEFLVLLGTVKSPELWSYGVVGGLAVVLGAAYMLWMVQRVFFGPLENEKNKHLTDVNLRELLTAAPLILLIAVMGLMPQPILNVIAPSTRHFVNRYEFSAHPGKVTEAQVRMQVREFPGDATAMAAPAAAPAPLQAVLPMPPPPGESPPPMPSEEGPSRRRVRMVPTRLPPPAVVAPAAEERR